MKKLLFSILVFCSIKAKSQTLTPPFIENFNAGLNGWILPTPNTPHDFNWWNTGGELLNGTPTACVRTDLNVITNFLSSPPINLIAGKSYNAVFKEWVYVGPSSRKIKVGYNTTPQLTGATIFYDEFLSSNAYVQNPFLQRSPSFIAPTTGVYYLVYYLYNYDNTTSYTGVRMDDMGIEEAKFPLITLNTPTNNFIKNENYLDSTRIYYDATASDIDGTVTKVEYYLDTTKVSESLLPPYTYTLKDANPGVHKIYAAATDNRGNRTTSDTNIVTIKFRDGTLKPYVQWDYNDRNPNGAGLNYWQFPPNSSAIFTVNAFFRNSQCMYVLTTTASSYAISPSVTLKAGGTYDLEFLAKTGGGDRLWKFYYTKTASFADTVLIDTSMIKGMAAGVIPEFDYVRKKTFVAPTDGVYNILFYPTVIGNQKTRFDQIRVIGNDLNVGPTSKMTYPLAGLVYADNAKIVLKSEARDIDGTVTKVEYYSNNVKVAESFVPPFDATWTNPPQGANDVYAKAFDNSGGYGISPSVTITGVPNQFKADGFLGTAGFDEIRGAVIKENNDIVYAANIGNINIAGATKYYLNGATDASPGAILILSSDGKKLKSITRVCTKIADLSKDRNDNLYLACIGEGVIKLNPTATYMFWKNLPTNGKNVQRIDAGPSGKHVVLYAVETSIDDATLTGTIAYLYDKDGVQLTTCSGIGQYGADVCIDETNQLVITVGFKNFSTTDLSGTNGSQPVYVPIMKGFNFSGVQVWKDYDWSSSPTDLGPPPLPMWLNMQDNNMADARLSRCSIGKDGKLYAMGQIYGGNHLFRYDPKNITQAGQMAASTDTWFSMQNTGTEIHTIIGRYNPVNGDVIRNQTITARLGSTKGNSFISEFGDINADEFGNCYFTGTSAYGMPMAVEYQPGLYTGGGFLMMTNYSMTTRTLSLRLSESGYGKALAVKKKDQMTFAGKTTAAEMYVSNPLQALSAGGTDAFYAVLNNINCTLPDSAISIAPATFERKTLLANNLMVDDNCKPIATIIPIGNTSTTAISDSVRVKVFVDAMANADFVKRHYQITPYDNLGNVLANANTKTGTITLYFTQAEFDAYNLLNTAKLPTGVADVDGIGRILIDKYPGISSDGTGLPATYTGTKQTINPADVNIIWNVTQSRWEITFDVTGFSGFFVKGFNTYIFTGNGNWTDAANWKDGNVPPLVLLDKSEIIIDPIVTGECFLDLSAAQIQEIKTGASLNVMPGKKLRLPAGLTIE
jgi:hypothetical protein